MEYKKWEEIDSHIKQLESYKKNSLDPLKQKPRYNNIWWQLLFLALVLGVILLYVSLQEAVMKMKTFEFNSFLIGIASLATSIFFFKKEYDHKKSKQWYLDDLDRQILNLKKKLWEDDDSVCSNCGHKIEPTERTLGR